MSHRIDFRPGGPTYDRVVNVASDYTVGTTDGLVVVTPGSGNTVIVSLPSTAVRVEGELTIAQIGPGTTSILPFGSETIAGDATVTLTEDRAMVSIEPRGAGLGWVYEDKGVPGVGGVSDTEWTQIADISGGIYDYWTGASLNLAGTNGYCSGRWIRIGRFIEFRFAVVADTDHDNGVFFLKFEDAGLPAPRDPNSDAPSSLVYSSNFTYVTVANNVFPPTPYNGWVEPLGPAIARDGTNTTAGLVLVTMSRVAVPIPNAVYWDTTGGLGHDAALDAVFGPNTYLSAGQVTIDTTGRAFQMFGGVTYEPSTAA